MTVTAIATTPRDCGLCGSPKYRSGDGFLRCGHCDEGCPSGPASCTACYLAPYRDAPYGNTRGLPNAPGDDA